MGEEGTDAEGAEEHQGDLRIAHLYGRVTATKLDQLSKWINISIYDINGEITDLMSK